MRAILSATCRERMALLGAVMALRQEGEEVGCVAKVFWTMAVGLRYNDAALKDTFNCCLDDPLPQCEMEGLQDLDFWRFAAYLHHRIEWASPSQPGSVHAPDHEYVSEVTGEVGTEPQLHPVLHALPISPVMAKRVLFTFYVLAVLRAWSMHLEQPEPAAVPEQPALPDTATEAVTELPALPDTATEHPWSALPPPSKPFALPPPPPRLSALPPLPRPSEPLESAWSVPPAPPWQSARTPDPLEPAWSVPPAPPWHSARIPDPLEPAWSVPPAPPWLSVGACWIWPAIPPPDPPPIHLPPEFLFCSG
ncbi:hypothetical protein DPX16_3291 [Anabarilius grahami]|uniref:Uncharacterized protein n=1 Tax=Anabarilius grahami TaxID=495550 RepID=A0A3N0XS21_ANAGA|nr:hypothetical protein DPX16_3291 [Anabarilius grahami]